jgi:anhydro-N-acetylmuramic acid kinase
MYEWEFVELSCPLKAETQYRVIGLMSGSSLDGLDMAYCLFTGSESAWSHEILATSWVAYAEDWKLRLKNLDRQDVATFLKGDVDFGRYIGELVRAFISGHGIAAEVDFIASHGHTIMHQPERGVTIQVGDGAAIAAVTGLPVVCDFRTADVAHGGQGAPIVPIGDRILFSDYSHCLNLGGIANISCHMDEKRIIGYDICAANSLLDAMAEQIGQPFDEDGKLSGSGQVNDDLLKELNSSAYFEGQYPKSLNAELVRQMIGPAMANQHVTTKDKLATACEHVALQVGSEMHRIYRREGWNQKPDHKLLVTGGGAFNKHLIGRLRAHSPISVEAPTPELIKFKEAIVMGLLGVLRMENQVNCLAQVTGARKDTIGGVVHEP